MKSVVLGLSGGVDSFAGAVMLKEKGYDVTGLYFDVTAKGNIQARMRAEKAAERLGIGFIYKNICDEFETLVIEPFCKAYEEGKTPSPCVMCNPLVKFRLLKDMGSDYIATGHYARIAEKNGVYYVRRAVNREKDQSYMLSRLPQDILSELILPLGEIPSKEEVRKLAGSFDTDISQIKDSQDICFISGDYRNFLRSRNISGRNGSFVTPEGKVLGPHSGTANYTYGQRKGLGIALGAPAFVSCIDAESGNITLTVNEGDLLRTDVFISDIVFTEKPSEAADYMAKLRYSSGMSKCRAEYAEHNGKSGIILHFDEAQRAPTKGQAAVIYNDDLVIASGIIYN